MVGGALVDERVGDSGAEGVDEGGPGRSGLLGALVALDAARVVVLGLAFLVGELHAVPAPVARVHHVDVVDEPAEYPGAARRVGPDPVAVHGDELLALRICAARPGERRDTQHCGLSESQHHGNPPLISSSPCFAPGYRTNSYG